MTAPNRNTLWAETMVAEFVAAGITSVCIAPGSRSTPLTVAFARSDDVEMFSHLDERSAAFFALGRAKRTGVPTPLVCTSGTAAANFHPAVIEADQARVPLVLLTADRPPELRDSGANQTIDQVKLYGDAVRWYADLPEPKPEPRSLRSLRTTVARAAATATGTPPGPVHLNVPFEKPLEPTEVPDDVPENLAARDAEAVAGRDGPWVRTTIGQPTLDEADLDLIRSAVSTADRGFIVAGPSNGPAPSRDALAALAHATGFPVLADPLSGHRFGDHVPNCPVVGGYDGFFDERVTADWADPEVVIRFGASPTSKPLRKYLARTDSRQFVVDPAGEWREAEFTATDLVVADETRFAKALADGVSVTTNESWGDTLLDAESRYWEFIADERGDTLFEGAILADVARLAPDPATMFVSNSMPIRDLDRFGRPRAADLTVLGNRGASGIDGITSTALGAGSATDDPLVLVTGDLAYYHDMNGLLALDRCGVDATIVLVNNDGGGIFHMLPIEDFDPPFTGQFKTPHGLDFEPTSDIYDLEFSRAESLDGFQDAYRNSLGSDGTQVIEVVTDAEESHRFRESLTERITDNLAEEA